MPKFKVGASLTNRLVPGMRWVLVRVNHSSGIFANKMREAEATELFLQG